MRTMLGITLYLQPLEETIHLVLLPALTGQNKFGDVIQDLLALPASARVRGLDLIIPVQEAVSQFRTSIKVTTSLVKQILHQSKDYPPEAARELLEIKSEVQREKAERTCPG